MGERVPASIVLDDGRLEVRRVNVELLSLQDSDSDSEGSVQVSGTRKRKRLTNLSPEEKMLRRKLKNRMAAQTARDRKKQKMSELEELLAVMEAENQKLLEENQSLKLSTSTLSRENQILKGRLHTPAADNTYVVKSEEDSVEEVVVLEDESYTKEEESTAAADAVSTERLSESMKSAVLVPQQKESTRAISSLLTVLSIYHVLSVFSLVHCMSVMKAVSSNTMEMKKEDSTSVELSLPSDPSLPPWWGSHQRNWNPSMN